MNSFDLGLSLVEGLCGHCYEVSGSIKGEQYHDQMSDCELFKKDSLPWN